MPERTREVTTVVGVEEVMAWVPKGSVPADQLVTDEQLRALPDCKANEEALREAVRHRDRLDAAIVAAHDILTKSGIGREGEALLVRVQNVLIQLQTARVRVKDERTGTPAQETIAQAHRKLDDAGIAANGLPLVERIAAVLDKVREEREDGEAPRTAVFEAHEKLDKAGIEGPNEMLVTRVANVLKLLEAARAREEIERVAGRVLRLERDDWGTQCDELAEKYEASAQSADRWLKERDDARLEAANLRSELHSSQLNANTNFENVRRKMEQIVQLRNRVEDAESKQTEAIKALEEARLEVSNLRLALDLHAAELQACHAEFPSGFPNHSLELRVRSMAKRLKGREEALERTDKALTKADKEAGTDEVWEVAERVVGWLFESRKKAEEQAGVLEQVSKMLDAATPPIEGLTLPLRVEAAIERSVGWQDSYERANQTWPALEDNLNQSIAKYKAALESAEGAARHEADACMKLQIELADSKEEIAHLKRQARASVPDAWIKWYDSGVDGYVLREAPTQSHSDWQAYTRYYSATALDVTVSAAVKAEKERLVGIWEEALKKAGGCIVCRALIAREKEPK